MADKRCLVRFVPQAWINDYAVDIDGAHDIDVTERLMEMDRSEALKIEDCSYKSDALVEGLFDHGGPYSVFCEEQIAEFFKEEA